MATQQWGPGEFYAPGTLRVPRSNPGSVAASIPNADFEAGDVEWTKGAGWTIVDGSPGFDGDGFARMASVVAGTPIQTEDAFPVDAGQAIQLKVMVRIGGIGNTSGARAALVWYDQGGNPVASTPFTVGSTVNGTSGAWVESIVYGTAPVRGFVRPGANATRNGAQTIDVDAFSWNYTAPPSSRLQYKAVQAESGITGTIEPVWPLVLGETVVDNEVTWEAVSISRVVWKARPLLKSGAVEPTWPSQPGARVIDGTISWEALSRRVEDPNCPNSKVVVILASKIFAGDGDIAPYSATLNALDWTSVENAGFLPVAMTGANSNDIAVMNKYRGNLVLFNASSFQHWQADPDPALMSLLDQIDGIGSTWQKAAQPVANELLYLSQLGVRSVGIAAGAQTLAAGDIGMPIDSLVQAAIAHAVASGTEPVATYYPSAGQYWLAFRNYPAAGGSTVFVCTLNGSKGKWSRYLFPFAIEAFAQLGDDLYVRHGDAVSKLSEDAVADELADGTSVEFPGTVWWPWLDFGTPGVTKMLHGFDIVSDGLPSISIGYDQRDLSAFTEPYALPADTLPGGMIPLPVSAPTMSVRLDFAGGEKWSLSSVMLYVDQHRPGV